MTRRAFRPIAALLSILLLSGVPTHAAPVAISQVIQVIGTYQNPPELRLRNVSQNTNSYVDDRDGLATTSTTKESAPDRVTELPYGGAGDAITSGADTLLSDVAVSAEQQGGVDISDQGIVEGAVCDCGEITVPGGGIPKWPLLFLAAIPFFFIHGCDDCETPPTSTPTPPGTREIPEPTSLLLLGTGLAAFGAGLRKRYSRSKREAQLQTTEEG